MSSTTGSIEEKAYYISIPVISLCSFAMLVLVIKLIYKLYVLGKSKSLMPFIANLTTVCMISCLICGILDLYDDIICFNSDRYLFERDITPFAIANNCMYTIILMSLFGLFIGRLYYTFSNTIFSLSKYFMYFIYFLVITSIICFIPAEIGYAHASTLFSYHLSISIIIICDSVLNIMCITLFFVKLKQIANSLESEFEYQMVTVLEDDGSRLLYNNIDGSLNKQHIDLDFHAQTYHETINEHKQTENDNSESNSTSTEEPNQMNLINIIIRHTILSIISIFFNQVWYCCLSYYTFIVDVNDMTEPAYNNIISLELCLRTVYLCVNCFILYFNLNINHWIYYSIYKSCHLCCYNSCTKKNQKNHHNNEAYHQMI
eukprot:542877_1